MREPEPREFCRRLAGRTIRAVARRGKYLIFHLDSGESLIVHLKMTGALLLRGPAFGPEPYLRALFLLDDGRELRFADARKLGRLWLVDDAQKVVGKLGPDALAADFTPQVLAVRLGSRRAPLKPLLMDQEFVSGLGNIYADEALFLAGIHPLRPAHQVSPTEVATLHQAIGQVLHQAMANRGTSFSDYRDLSGEPGNNVGELRVYRRRGQPCFRCQTPIERMALRGRGTYFCPRCQG